VHTPRLPTLIRANTIAFKHGLNDHRLTYNRYAPCTHCVILSFSDGKMAGLGTFTWGTGESYYGWWKDGVMDGENPVLPHHKAITPLSPTLKPMATTCVELPPTHTCNQMRRLDSSQTRTRLTAQSDSLRSHCCCAGKGKFTFASGSHYTGGFVNGKMHGQGKLAVLITAADGSVSEVAQEGVWQDGVFVPPVDASPTKPGSGKKKK
jgi:hypothetical protein